MLLAAGQVGGTTWGVSIPITGQAMPHLFNTEEVHPRISLIPAWALVKSLASLSDAVLWKIWAQHLYFQSFFSLLLCLQDWQRQGAGCDQPYVSPFETSPHAQTIPGLVAT